MKVAIIGAGIGGLTSLKSCKEEGLEATCFEMTSHIGGLWSPRKADVGVSAAYDHLVSNTNKELMAFTDYPMPSSYPTYPTRNQVHEYLLSYSKKFDLEGNIKVLHKVEKVEKSDDHDRTGCWDITVTTLSAAGSSNATTVHRFDAVMVCVGIFGYPHIIQIPGMHKFKGRIIHSNQYEGHKAYQAEDRVLVIGNAHSGCDMATDLCHRTSKTDKVVDGIVRSVRTELSDSGDTDESAAVVNNALDTVQKSLESDKPPVYLSSRSGVSVIKRNYGKPMGLNLSFATEAIRMHLPLLYSTLLRSRLNSGFDFKKYGMVSPAAVPGRNVAAVNDYLYDYVKKGKIQAVLETVEFSEHHATLADGQSLELDSVILATGCDIQLPFISPELIDTSSLQLYKHIWPVNQPRSTLAVIGLFRVAGPFPVIIEMQARWAVQVFKGAVRLPSEDVMKSASRIYTPNTGDHIRVQFISYCREIAEIIGCLPTFSMYMTQPLKWLRIFFGPAYPYLYRLVGPGKCAESWERIRTARSRIHPSAREVQEEKEHRKKRNDNIFMGALVVGGGIVWLSVYGVTIYQVWQLQKSGWGFIKSVWSMFK